MAEIAGSTALEEIVLDSALKRSLDRAGIRLSAEQIRAEADRLTEATPPGADPSSIRAARGLGPVRYPAALRRTAALRALVRAGAEPADAVTDQQVDLELARRSSSSWRLRVITTPSEREASRLRAEIDQTPDEHRSAKAALAALEHSLGPAANRGGLVESLSAADPTAPSALLSSLHDTGKLQLTRIIATDEGFLFALVLDTTPARRPSAEDRETVARDIAEQAEREAMQRLALRLISESELRVLDPSLNWSRTNAQSNR